MAPMQKNLRQMKPNQDDLNIKRRITTLLQELADDDLERMPWKEALKMRMATPAIGQQNSLENESDVENPNDESQQLLQRYNVAPSVFVVREVYDHALRNWKIKKLKPTRVFSLCNYIIDLIEPTKMFNKKLWDLVFLDLSQVLQDNRWSPTALCEKTSVLLGFEKLIAVLRFLCAYLIHAFNNRKVYPAYKLKAISDVILKILMLLVSVPRTDEQEELLTKSVRAYFRTTHVWNIPSVNLLIKVCASYHPIDINSPNLNLTQFLLKAGADPNVVDTHNCTPLHILADKESRNSRRWPHCKSVKHQEKFKNFTKTVKSFLDHTQHHEYHDQENFDGQFALELLSQMDYPDTGLQRFLGKRLRCVSPLACLAAQKVRRFNIDYDRVHAELQAFILQH